MEIKILATPPEATCQAGVGDEFDGGIDENAEREVGRCVDVPVVHPVLGSLVRVPDNNPKKDQIN